MYGQIYIAHRVYYYNNYKKTPYKSNACNNFQPPCSPDAQVPFTV